MSKKSTTRMTFAVVLLAVVLLGTGCTTVQPYERAYLNDDAMAIGSSSVQAFENYVEDIREGSIVPGDSKSSGGCGCN